LISWQLDAEPLAKLVVLPRDAASLDEAELAIELWERYSGKRLEPAQRLAVQIMMAETADGLWAALTTGREMPRQNGKGEEIEVVELWGLVQRGEAILHTVHEAVMLATQAQQRLLSVLEGHRDLRRKIKRHWRGTGQQMTELLNGGVIWYRTRSGGGGRGLDDIDRLVVDEAQHATDEQLSAITPTLLANANPQLNVLGTAALPNNKSAWWWTVRRRALSNDPGRFGYLGHTAETVYLNDAGHVVQEPVDVEDRTLWAASNPSLHTGRGQGWDFYEEQLRTLGSAGFAREHLGVWEPPFEEGSGPINLETWAALAELSEIHTHLQIGLALSPDRSWATLAVAGRRADGYAHVEARDWRAGTGWVVDRVVEAWQAARIPIRVHAQGPAASFIPELVERGVEVVD